MITPKQSVIEECRGCLGNYQIDCLSDICYLGKDLRYMNRIKEHCAHCSPNWNVDNCEIFDCPLYPFRSGKNPNRVAGGKRRLGQHKAW